MHIIKGTDVAGGGDAAWIKTILIGDGVNWPTRLRVDQVRSLNSVFIADPATYRFPVVTKVRFNLVDGTSFTVEVQDVENQPSWKLGTKAALNTALDDLQTFLN